MSARRAGIKEYPESPPGRNGLQVVQIVSNPAAGGHCAARVQAIADAFVRAGVDVIRSECGPQHSIALESRADHVCVVGGDGTMRHAVCAARLSGRTMPLSLYPAGTINLLRREAGCALDPDAFAAHVLSAEAPRSHYAAAIGDSLFLTCASVGPDSAAVAAVSSRLKARIGRLAYAVAFLRVLVRWPRPSITLRCEGRSISCEAFYVAKGRFFAGPWSFAPDARVDDPRLHLVALPRLTRRLYAHFIWALATGRPMDCLPGAICLSFTALDADCDEAVPVQGDGDIVATLPLSIRLNPEPFAFL